MTRLMYDSINPAAIPITAPLVGGYIDGIYGPNFKAIGRSRVGWDAAGWARFPNSIHVPISAIGTDAGIVGDVEVGCIWPPAKAVPWVEMRRAAGIDPTIYCNETNDLPSLVAVFKTAKVQLPYLWCSNYDNVAKLRKGEVARQYANSAITGHNYDLSVVADFWPGVDRIEDDMLFLVSEPTQGVFIVGEMGKRHVKPPEFSKMLAQAGSMANLKIQQITAADLATIPDIPTVVGGSIDFTPVTNLLNKLISDVAHAQEIIDKIDRGE